MYRIIPCLLLKDKGLVKTYKFNKTRYIGDPVNTVKIFNEKEVDELIFLDIRATIYGRKPDIDLIHDIASESFMPICYGGGITKTEEIKKGNKLHQKDQAEMYLDVSQNSNRISKNK